MDSPQPMNDCARMGCVPLYPAYAWTAVPGAAAYEFELWHGDERRAHWRLRDTMSFDGQPLTECGHWWWRVRALDAGDNAGSEWSPRVDWHVTAPTPFAAFGDSITHGWSMYPELRYRVEHCWQSYAGLAVKNLGLSGDTTADMLRRYAPDVRPFAPTVLVIMGGVNDCRLGADADSIIANLARIRERSLADGATPVMATLTPMNPALMLRMWGDAPIGDWRGCERAVNRWVMAQPHHVDVASPLTDERGELAAALTADGLHPERAGKRVIGETIGAYLRENFGHVHDR